MRSESDLFAVAEQWLTLCELATASTPDGTPALSFVSPGPPSWDCIPMLSVHCVGPVLADTAPLQPPLAPGHRAQTQQGRTLVGYVCTILRCAPQITGPGNRLPSGSEMTAVAAQVHADLWAIWQYTRQAKSDDDGWFGNQWQELFQDPAVAVNQQGGACGWQIQIRVQLDGYSPVIASPAVTLEGVPPVAV